MSKNFLNSNLKSIDKFDTLMKNNNFRESKKFLTPSPDFRPTYALKPKFSLRTNSKSNIIKK